MGYRPPPWPEVTPRQRCEWCKRLSECRRVHKPKQVIQGGRVGIIYVSLVMCEECIYSFEVLHDG